MSRVPDIRPEFREEYEAESLRRLRRQFLVYSGGLGALAVVFAGLVAWRLFGGAAGDEPAGLSGRLLRTGMVASVAQAAIFLVPFFWMLRRARRTPRDGILRLVFWMILAHCVVQWLPAPVLAALLTRAARRAGLIAQSASLGVLYPVLIQTLLTHLSAAILIPWTAREAIRPLVPVLGFYAAATLLAPLLGKGDRFENAVVLIPILGLVGVPGVAVSWWRHSRFRRSFEDRAVRERYGEIVGELASAKRIHERLFPRPIRDRAVAFDYAYEPMRLIGGDFLYVRPRGEGLNLVLIDVTGHGISAALTVNRLHGELNRIFGREPDAAPGAVLAELNEYVNLTLASDGVFATALCIRVDPGARTIEWANAGHPPAFLRRAGGGIERLDPTVFLLGAVGDAEFEAGGARTGFGPGDAVLAYTDGAIEVQGADGALGIDGLERLAAAADARSGWSAAVLRAVKAFREGPVQDDTLLVELRAAGAGTEGCAGAGERAGA